MTHNNGKQAPEKAQKALLKRRFRPRKPSTILIDTDHTVAGVFVLKFVEGSHIRLGENGLFVDVAAIKANAEERGRLARAGLKAASAAEQLASIIDILDFGRKKAGFEVGYAFRPEAFRYTTDDKDADSPFREKDELEQRSGEELADLDLYYVVYAQEFYDLEFQQQLMNQLNPLKIVEQVYPAVLADVPRAPTPDLTRQQGYLDAAPAGLDARYAWTRPGGRGDGVQLIDVEYDWVTDHEDFPPSRARFWGGRPACAYDGSESEHGTAVMGIIAAPDNGRGVSGFAPNIRFGLATVCRPFDYVWAGIKATFSGENWIGRAHNVVVSNSIHQAAEVLRPGDVLLIEQHTHGPRTGRFCPSGGNCPQWEYVAMEYYQECFDVIRRATARGVIVVEAAGNGTQNLDAPVYGRRFFTSVRHSGALMVAGSGQGDGRPNGSTNSSQRIDVHAWGAGVVSIGYGRDTNAPFDNTPPINRRYLASFNGTSSAAAIVAGAVASLQGTRRAAGFPPLTPVEMKRLLASTGSPQLGTFEEREAQPIGVQPNLRAAIDIATASGGSFTGPGLYTIRSKSSGLVLDIDIGWFRGQNDGQALLQWEFHGGRNQQFVVVAVRTGGFLILTRHTGATKVLDVTGGSLADGAPVQQFQSLGGNNQIFRIEPIGGFYRIVAAHSGKALDVPGASRDNGAQIQQFSWHGGDNQLFEFMPVE